MTNGSNGAEPVKKIVPSAKPFAQVWGSPISHSRSPVLHRCAYAELGVQWEYTSLEVTKDSLATEFSEVAPQCVGLSLTMPLKDKILSLVGAHDHIVSALGVANTVVFSPSGPRLVNTDVAGVMGALGDVGLAPEKVWIIGAGATARAVGFALAAMGTTDITLMARSPQRAEATRATLEGFGPAVEVVGFEAASDADAPDLVVSTLPQVDIFPLELTPEITAHSALFDVSYSPWPSAAALLWAGSTQPVVSGLSMLVHQAVHQVRWFYGGDGEEPLPKERAITRAMKHSVGLAEV